MTERPTSPTNSPQSVRSGSEDVQSDLSRKRLLREDEIVAEYWLDRDHWPEGQAIRRLARAVALREITDSADG